MGGYLMDALYANPWVLGGILIMPILIIGLAKSWKRLKDKKAEAAAAASQQQSQTPGS
jgi:hypothetical protein